MKFTKLLPMVVVLCASANLTFAQNNFTVYAMPGAIVKYNLSKKTSQSFATENRNFAYHSGDFDLKVKHLEFSHFTKYEFKKGHQLGLGVNYRFESGKGENELRLLQQYEWKSEKIQALKHRLRTEERIYNSLTKYRLRYQAKLSFVTKAFFDRVSLANELALEVSSIKKPDYEERIGFFGEWDLTKKTVLEIGSQYRLSNFTQAPTHNLFLSATLGVSI